VQRRDGQSARAIFMRPLSRTLFGRRWLAEEHGAEASDCESGCGARGRGRSAGEGVLCFHSFDGDLWEVVGGGGELKR
jgi:hypothetical protein